MAARLQIDVTGGGDAVTVALRGELDLSTAGLAEDALHEAEAQSPALVVIDLSRLSFLDSTGLRLVVSADARARAEGRRLAVVKGPDAVHRVFVITRLEERLDMVEDEGALAGG